VNGEEDESKDVESQEDKEAIALKKRMWVGNGCREKKTWISTSV
jgi:hypothetical protein